MSGTASIPLAGGNGTPVVVNPSYVPPPSTAANNTDSNTHNNYQVVTGNDNIVVGKAVNTTVSQVRPRTVHVLKRSHGARLRCYWTVKPYPSCQCPSADIAAVQCALLCSSGRC